ncbi:hypothetical protein F0A17_01410 [Billgrantia pellis]|uniref:O-antigen ligase domain-containing protein n=1 Tax=Billgrantia pellis TaxID=2606936 RepID=A0A7V7G329_9GAMM|nr:hypothetical protein [Halomonas pellis]KAA0014340.1 hypothetical protein F0A17_01410 [Halomonas pellis]
MLKVDAVKYTTKTADVDSFRGGLRYIHGVTYAHICWLTLFLYLYLLSPYFDLRAAVLHGGMLSIVLFLGAHPAITLKAIQQIPLVSTFVGLCLFCLYNLTIFIFHTEVFATTFLTYMIQVALYILLGYVLALSLMTKSLDMDQVLTLCFKLVVFIVFVNSLIILIEYNFPPFRNFVESMLYLPENSNIDYLTREFRLRGIASGGAANLSLFHGTVLILLQALYIKKKIGFLYFITASVTIFTSLLFIGRTGIVVAIIGIALFHMLNFILSKEKLSLRRILLYASIAGIVMAVPPVFAILFPENVLSYSITFLYRGVEGVQQEGTTAALARMINIPNEWPKLLFGVGVHSGDFDLRRSVDLGYMRMFTALGIPVAIAFYVFVAYLGKCVLSVTHYKSFWLVFMIIMFIAEYKEPFIFKGYSARLMWMIIGVGLCYRFSGLHAYYKRSATA